MSSNAFALQLRIKPTPSRQLTVFLITAHGLAIPLLWPLDMAVWIKLTLLTAIVASFIHSWRHHVLRKGGKVIDEIILQQDGRWLLGNHKKEFFSAQLMTDSYVHPWLVILRFRHQYGTSNIVLLSDMIDVDMHRRLRVRLRHDTASLLEG